MVDLKGVIDESKLVAKDQTSQTNPNQAIEEKKEEVYDAAKPWNPHEFDGTDPFDHMQNQRDIEAREMANYYREKAEKSMAQGRIGLHTAAQWFDKAMAQDAQHSYTEALIRCGRAK